MKKRKQTIVGFMQRGWNIRLEDFGIIDLPLANIRKKRGRSEKVRVTIEHVSTEGVCACEDGVIIENEM